MSKTISALVLGALISTLSMSTSSTGALAATLGLDVVSSDGSSLTGSNTIGYSFSISQATSVTGLGMFDIGRNGFQAGGTNTVGLWDSTGSLITSAVINQSGSGSSYLTSAASQGDWLVTDVSAFALAAGTYTLGYQGQEAQLQTVTTISTAPFVTYLGGLVRFGGTFEAPNSTVSDSGSSYFGPTIVFDETAVVPIPAALPLLLSALSFFGFLGWRRKRLAAA